MQEAETPAAGRLTRVGQVWRSIVRAVQTSFRDRRREADRGILGLIDSTRNSLGETNLFVPGDKGCGTPEEYAELESKYTAYLSWLLGSFYSLLARDTDSDIHRRSAAIQGSILKLLADKRGFVFQKLVGEYLLCLADLAEIQDRECLPDVNKPIVLQRFVPAEGEVTLGAEQPITLETVPTEIRSLDHCASLQLSSLEILAQVLHEVLTHVPTNRDVVWRTICDLLENARCFVKVTAFRFSCRVVHIAGFSERADLRLRHLRCVELLVESDPFSPGPGNPAAHVDKRDVYLAALLSLSEAASKADEALSRRDRLCLLHTLMPVCLRARARDAGEELLAGVGRSVEALLRETGSSVDEKAVGRLVGSVDTCQHAMAVLEYCVSQELLEGDTSATWSALLAELGRLTERSARESDDTLRCLRAMRSIARCGVNARVEPRGFDGASLCAAMGRACRRLAGDDGEATRIVVGTAVDLMSTADEVGPTVGFALLPWLRAGPEVLDGVVDDGELRGLLLDVAARCKEHLSDVGVRRLCLARLVRLPPAHPLRPWVTALVIRCLEDEHSGLGAEAVRALTSLPCDSAVGLVEAVNGLVGTASGSSDPEVHLALSDVIGRVVCRTAGGCTHVRKVVDSRVVHELSCDVCDRPPTPDHPRPPSPLLPTGLVAAFLRLLDSPHPEARRNLALSLPRLSNHGLLSRVPHGRWIALVDDDAHGVRLSLAGVVGRLVGGVGGGGLLGAVNATLVRCVQRSLQGCDKLRQETLMITVREIGCVPLDSVLLPAFSMLMLFVGHHSSSMVLPAKECIASIAAAHNCKPMDLFVRYKPEMCQTLADLAVFNHAARGWNFSTAVRNMTRAAGFSGSIDFVTTDARSFLPRLIPALARHPAARTFLDDIVSLLGTTTQALVLEHFPFIYAHAYLFESPEVFERCKLYMEELTSMTLDELRAGSSKVIANELVLHLHAKRDAVLRGLGELARLDPRFSTLGPEEDVTEAGIADFLQPQFLGILVGFDNHFVLRPPACESTKRRALLALPGLVRLMGASHVTPVRFKLLATLRTALRLDRSDFPLLSCAAWEAFVVSVSTDQLGPLTATVFASLTPLIDRFPDEVGAVFRYLVETDRPGLSQHLNELYFVPDHPAIATTYDKIQRYIAEHRPATSDRQLEELRTFASHENVDVRIYGLGRLKEFLSTTRNTYLQKAIGQNETVDKEIADVLYTLIDGSKDPELVVGLKCGECLGEIGAIDPGTVPRPVFHKGTDQFPLYVLAGDTFAYQAITTLAKFYVSSRDTYNMDALSLALQDMLKTYKLTTDTVTTSELWQSFSQEVRELLTPLLTSRYKSTVEPELDWPDAISGTHYGSTFPEWTYHWASKLTSLITNKIIREMFFSCLLSFKRDFQVALYFLPFILLQALVFATDEAKEEIFVEVSAIVDGGGRRRRGAPPAARASSRRGYVAPAPPHQSAWDREKSLKIVKTVLTLVDFLQRWVREYKKAARPPKKGEKGVAGSTLGALDYRNISGFLERLPMSTIACSNYECHEYQRALMYEEEYLFEHPEELQNEMSFLAKIYGRLDDADMVAGVLARRVKEPTLTELVLAHEVTGRLRDAAACYERLGSEKDLSPGFLKGMVQCYLGLDQPYTALKLAECLMLQQPELAAAMLEVEAECFWRMCSFDQLDELFRSPELDGNTSWGVTVGRSIVAMRQHDQEALMVHLGEARRVIVNSLAVASLERTAYEQGYPDLVRLHMLNELEKTSWLVKTILEDSPDVDTCSALAARLFAEWDQRLEYVQHTSKVMEPVLCMRRTLLALARELLVPAVPALGGRLDVEMGRYWVRSAEVARKTQYFQEAQIYIMRAELHCPKEAFIEKAKLYWDMNKPEPAFCVLRRGLDEHFPQHKAGRWSASQVAERKLCAEAMLLLAQYNDKTMNIEVNKNIKLYKDAVEMHRTEENIVCLAQYYERLLGTFAEETRDWKGGNELHCHIIKEFGTSLQYGTDIIHQSMPKILTFWMDYVTRYSDLLLLANNRKNVTQLVDGLTLNERISQTAVIAESMTHQIEKFSETLPPYMFMTAFSQIMSRICHPQTLVSRVVKRIVRKLVLVYPQHTLWMLMPSLKSTQDSRRTACQEILSDERIRKTQLHRVVLDFIRLCEKFIDLADKEILEHQRNEVSMDQLLRTLPKLLSNKDFSKIMMPVEAMRTLVLPKATTEVELKAHDPFPNKMVYIQGVEDTITVIQSLQKPRKISLRGSDGKRYPMMCKPKDDLRIDLRMMEFNHVVNKYLVKDPESLQRGLTIRTFSVVPLNEECGLIEWIPNLKGLRPIIQKLYKERGISVRPDVKKHPKDASLSVKRERFIELLATHPPLFKEWFRDTFIDPCSWYLARTSYVRTTAVVSMVGYVMGLGDRHGENILYDTTTGETVHVDFNCLFDKGETFDVPERVPFRLTRNMTTAMGPLGVDGTFRHCCETALRVLQSRSETLVSVLRPFVYEPCAETEGDASWSRPSTSRRPNGRNEEIESRNDKALTNIANIGSRLGGYIRSNNKVYSLPLSVEGQVNHLILEATNVDNLCQMYMGWAPSY